MNKRERPVVQETRIFKAGNSLAIRIPRMIARRMALEDGLRVVIAANEKAIEVRRATSLALEDLIDRITPENTHKSEFNRLTGGEVW